MPYPQRRKLGMTIDCALAACVLLFGRHAASQTTGESRTFTADSEIGFVAFWLDANTLAGDARDSTIKLWDIRSGERKRVAKLGTIMEPSAVGAVAPSFTGLGISALSPNGKTVATGRADGAVELWDSETGKLMRTLLGPAGPGSGVNAIAFSPDGKTLASASDDGTAQLWDVEKGALLFTLRDGVGEVAALSFSPRSEALATASADANIRIWNTRTGVLEHTLTDLALETLALAYSPDGKTLASGGADKNVYLWDTISWTPRARLTGQSETIDALAFSPDGRVLASGGMSPLSVSAPAELRLWSVSSGELQKVFNLDHQVASVAFSPDGKMLAAADFEKNVKL